MSSNGWTGVDLDGTLAEYHGWADGAIGAPIPAMVRLVRDLLEAGQQVRIFTARVAPVGRNKAIVAEQRRLIQAWCERHLGQRLRVTCQKDFAMVTLYDDRVIRVEPNTGRLL